MHFREVVSRLSEGVLTASKEVDVHKLNIRTTKFRSKTCLMPVTLKIYGLPYQAYVNVPYMFTLTGFFPQ